MNGKLVKLLKHCAKANHLDYKHFKRFYLSQSKEIQLKYLQEIKADAAVNKKPTNQ